MKKSGVSRVRNKMVLVLVIANAMLFLASVVTKATNLMNLSVLLFLPIMALLIATNLATRRTSIFTEKAA